MKNNKQLLFSLVKEQFYSHFPIILGSCVGYSTAFLLGYANSQTSSLFLFVSFLRILICYDGINNRFNPSLWHAVVGAFLSYAVLFMWLGLPSSSSTFFIWLLSYYGIGHCIGVPLLRLYETKYNIAK